jgi:hypothetical protein
MSPRKLFDDNNVDEEEEDVTLSGSSKCSPPPSKKLNISCGHAATQSSASGVN